MVTIVKLCGKKTPLLERKRRRRPRAVHHEGGEHQPEEVVHVHPTAVKSTLPFMGRSYRMEREARRREKEERKSRRKVQDAPARKEATEGAEQLAARLAQRLVVSLPPEPRVTPLTMDSRRISEEQARHAVSSWLSTVSPVEPVEEEVLEPKVERRLEKENEEGKKKRSKSMSKAQEKEKEVVSKGERQGRSKKKENAEEEEDDKKGKTIAKLGPFKMSVELKGPGGGGGSSTGKAEKVEKDKEVSKGKVRSRSRSKPGEDKARRKSRVEEVKEVKTPEEEKTIEKDLKKQDKRKKERIVVSKLARSDRPMRERSPEKPRPRVEEQEGEEDYRLTLNRRREKFTRSVSQPGPAPSLDFLLPAVTSPSCGLGTRNMSFTEARPSAPALRRSNTLQEEVAPRPGTVYDNLGFDQSPDLRTGARAAEKRQQTLAAIKDQIQEQLAKASGPPLSLPSTVGRRRRESRRYQPMEEEELGRRYQPMNEEEVEEGKASDSDSLSSDPRLCRQSPPTQVLHLLVTVPV